MVSVRSLFQNKYWLTVAGIATLLFFMQGVAMSCTIYYAKAVLHNEGAVSGLTNSMNFAQIAAYFLSFLYIRKLGKGGSFRTGYILAIIAMVIRVFCGADYTLLIVSGVIMGLGAGMGAACLGGMISDTIEYGEWKTGVRCVGVGNAANTFAQKIGTGIGTAIVGWMLGAAGYQADAAVQSQSALLAINTCFIYIPLVCCVIIFLLTLTYKLDKEYPQIIKELQERHRR